MRLRFSDLERIKRTARDNAKHGMAGLRRWWSNKYKLPPNHELFLGQSVSELNMEMYEDWILRIEELTEILESGDPLYDHSVIQKEIDQLRKALGDEPEVYDDLIDKWEQQLENGEIPDLEEGLNRG